MLVVIVASSMYILLLSFIRLRIANPRVEAFTLQFLEEKSALLSSSRMTTTKNQIVRH